MIILAWLASCAVSAGMAIYASCRRLRGRPVSADYKTANLLAAVVAAVLTAVVLSAFIELGRQL